MPVLQNVWEIRMDAIAQAGTETPKKITNVFHYTIGATTTAPPSNDLIWNSFYVNVAQRVLAVVTTDYKLIQGSVRLLDTYENMESLIPVNVVGSVSPDRLPLFNSAVFLMRTGYRGRNYLGRKSFTCIPETHTTADLFNAAGIAAWTNVGNGMATALSAGGFSPAPVVLAKSLSQLMKNPISMIGAPVLSVTLNTIVGTMRRRKERASA